MPRVLFATWAGLGHLFPFVGVAKELAANGTELAWTFVPPVGEIDVARKELSKRCPGVPILGDDDTFSKTQMALTNDSQIRRARASPRRRASAQGMQDAWDEGVFVRWVPAAAASVEEAIRKFRPELIITEGLIYGSIIAAQRGAVPWVALSTQLTMIAPPDLSCPPRAAAEKLATARAELFARENIDAKFRMLECVSPHLNTAYTTTELAAGADVPANTHLVGPSIASDDASNTFPWSRLADDKPILYVAAGSSQLRWPLHVYIHLVALTAELGVQMIVSGVEHTDASPFPHVLCVPFAPQRELLRRVDAFVTHGGANSVMEAAQNAVPLLVIPMSNDQPIQAFFVARSGLGRALAPEECTEAQLRAALRALLDKNGIHRARAQAIRESYRKHDGAREAAARVMDLFSKR